MQHAHLQKMGDRGDLHCVFINLKHKAEPTLLNWRQRSYLKLNLSEWTLWNHIAASMEDLNFICGTDFEQFRWSL